MGGERGGVIMSPVNLLIAKAIGFGVMGLIGLAVLLALAYVVWLVTKKSTVNNNKNHTPLMQVKPHFKYFLTVYLRWIVKTIPSLPVAEETL